MAFRRSFALFVALSTSVLAGQVQKTGLTVPSSYASNTDAVKTIFNTSYQAYKQYAWGHDDLSPLSKSYSDPLGGWGATIADALDTLYLMGFEDDFLAGVNYTSTINFNQSNTPDTVSVFETSIRYVGGYLSAYEISGKKYPILVEKAKEVADKLLVGFVGDNPIPYNYVDFSTNQPASGTSNVAQAGTLTLEYSRLSEYTGNDTYRRLAEDAVRWIVNLTDPLPGLPAQGIDPATGQYVGSYVTWGGGTDSYLEYLIKYARLTNTDDPIFANEWALAVDSSINTLQRTSTVGNWTYMADWNNGTIIHVASHLECFHGGNWLLGGSLLNNQTIINKGLELTEACWNSYASTATGIGPEVFYYISSDGNYTGDSPPTADQLAFYNEHGFYISAADYIQRPEVLETNFYAWRVTGDTKYLDRAASAIASFNEYLPAGGGGAGFAGLNDVNNKQGSQIDDQESFWGAEVLKYLFLTFDDPSHISLDDYVFNTECHPYQAPAAKSVYGSGSPTTNHQPGGFRTQTGPLPAISPDPALPTPLIDVLHLN